MSDRISRTEALARLAAAVPAVAAGLAATTAAANAAADDSAGTKKTYKYQDKPGKGGAKCASCTLFKAPHGCQIVKGKISPNGWCIAYNKKA